MAFPETPLPLNAEMLIDSTWTDITSDVRGNNDAVSITRGYQNEQGDSLTPASCNFKLNNRAFRFSNRNPASANYGKLPMNTQVRFSLDDVYGNAWAPVNGESYSYGFATYASEYVSTTDKAVLDITGDIDIRVDAQPESWAPRQELMLAHKYVISGNQRSWYFALRSDGKLELAWSPDGTSAARIFAVSTAAVALTVRGAVRVTLDVNNGAAGNTVAFYTSDTIAGTWTQLGASVVTAGVTSIFSSSAPLHIGGGGLTTSQTGGTPLDNVYGFRGRMYRAQVYQNIAGTLRADANFGAQTAGATSWSDGLGTPNTWTVTAVYGGITVGAYRFWGEVAEMPQKADPSGRDLYVPTVASDIIRRITQGETAVSSPMQRYISRFTTKTQWQALETGVSTSGTTGTAGSAIGGPAARYNDLSFGAEDEIPGTAGAATFNSAASYISAYAKGSANATYQSIMFSFVFPTTPGSEIQMVSLGSTGTIRRWTISCTATTFVLRGFDAVGTEVGNQATTFGTGVSPARWLLMRLQTHVVGSFIIAELAWCQVQDSAVWGSTSTTQFPGTTGGRFTGYNFAADAGLNGYKVSQIMLAQEEIPATDYDFYNAAGAYDGEYAALRALRTATSAGVPLILSGLASDTTRMGPEPRSTSVAIMEECAKVDGGFLTTRRDAPAFHFISRNYLLDQNPLALNHALKPFSGTLDPTDDDATLRNAVTITSPAGQTGTSLVTAGPKGSDTVGRYDSSYQLNGFEGVVTYLAQYATYLGTWDEIRLPQFAVQLARRAFASDATLTAGVRALEIGSAVRIDNPPTWFPPDSLELMVRGYRETMSNFVHDIAASAQNYGPFRHTNDLSAEADVPRRAAGTNSSLNAGITSTATSMVVKTPTGALWGTTAAKPGNFPINVMVGGEVITVSGITSATSPQTFAISARSVNGVVKAHLADDPVQVADRFYAAL